MEIAWQVFVRQYTVNYLLTIALTYQMIIGMTKYRKGPQRTTKDRKGPQRTNKRPTKDRKGALRAKLQEVDTN